VSQDGDGSDTEKPGGEVLAPADIPPTRKHEVSEEPPRRASATDLHAPLSFPDDSSLSGTLRRIDKYLGAVEQIVLVTILAIVVVIAASHALLDRIAHYQISFKDDVIRGGTFAIAMLGGAFATHQARHLSMDLISRRMSARARLFLKVALALFTIAIVVLLVRAGFHTIAVEETVPHEDKLITPLRIAWLIPIGGALIIIHTLLHTIIDLDYIVRRKTPPERMRSGH
jgi:TRAP-type C4-dicarboxylate transport system permease small subunit